MRRGPSALRDSGGLGALERHHTLAFKPLVELGAVNVDSPRDFDQSGREAVPFGVEDPPPQLILREPRSLRRKLPDRAQLLIIDQAITPSSLG